MAVERYAESVPERLPPHNTAAEEAVLGSILIDPESLNGVAPLVRAEDFYRSRNGLIFAAMLALHDRREPVDYLTLADELQRQDKYEEIGGLPYLASLLSVVPTAAFAEHYARIIERTAVMRRMISAAAEIARLGYQDNQDIDDALERAEQLLMGVAQRRSTKDFAHVAEVLREYLEQLRAIQDDAQTKYGIPGGFIDLDKITGGFQRSDLIILAARPSIGKTSLALNIAANSAMKFNATVAVFSLEMSAWQLAARLLSMEAGVDSARLRLGRLNADESRRLGMALGELSEAPLYIDDTPGIGIMELRSKARRLANEKGLDMVIVDYLQLIIAGSKDNRVQEISEISRSLKGLARELRVPVIALSQLSRAVEARSPKIPMLSDLRESGCLSAETPVYLPDSGAYRPIGELAGQRGFRVLALNPATWRLEPRTVTNAFCTGRKPVYRLTTGLGRSVRATANHNFLTIEGWKRLDELTPGTRIALPRRLPSPAVQTMDDARLALLGHLIGDGCTLARHAVQYTTNEPGLAETVAALAETAFPDQISPRIRQERRWYQVYLSATERLTHGVRNPVAAWLDGIGAFGLRSYEKRIPEIVFAQADAGIARFLRHLWATDGCVHLGLVERPGHYPAIYYASSSPRLAHDVQSLLLRLHINAALFRVKQGRKGRDQYHVIVGGKTDVQRFLDVVGVLGERKQAHARRIAEYFESRPENTNRDVIPANVWRTYAVPAMQAAGITGRQMQASLGNSYCGTSLYKQNLGRARALRLAEIVCSAPLRSLAESDVYWDTIRAIEPDGETDVYDLTVEGLHNFVAGDIVVHNSIEQDADIVLFIYREDVYEPETEKKNIADIIIAKHRNGPTGQVSLRFEKSTTKFQDLLPDYYA